MTAEGLLGERRLRLLETVDGLVDVALEVFGRLYRL